ncbi:hypothetical protein GX50_01621 [[Emmonsia] crescens]|uniref:Major facilitator superfamily (MFS) profile domain-containing protein n=1 Tax=[Emmonsia] crescens TaxID=73230 RepID=A0A2B7ZQR5_9EURO|nr:hypothetical protein GX50_01621 [Emmonsia crescens]
MEQEKEPNSAVSSPECVEKLAYAAQQLDPKVERRLLWKLDLHIVPILFLVYFCAFLDRINVGNALIEGIVEELNMNSTSDIRIALLIFFVPYILLEVPSNIVLKRVAPSTWITILTFFFGLVTVCQGFVESPTGFIVCRFFLGVFEAGLLPGFIYLMSMYYKRHELQKRFAVLFTSGMVAGAVGGLLAFSLAKLDGVGGYSGWRWIFIVEGLMSISLSFLAKFLIVDWPSEATFLTDEERLMVAVRLKEDVGSSKMDRLVRQSLQIILKDWKIYTGALIYFTITTSGYSTALFNPTILNQFGYEASQAQVHSIPIWAASAAATLLVGYLSDRIRHRWSFIMFGCLLSSIGYILLLCQSHVSLTVKHMALFIVNIGVYIAQPVTVVWLSNNLAGHYKRAFGSAFQISFGNIGGIVASNLFILNAAPLFRAGYASALALIALCALLCTGFMLGLERENKKRDSGRRDYRFNLCQDELENLGDDHPDFRFTN